jgi:hypothetical protein
MNMRFFERMRRRLARKRRGQAQAAARRRGRFMVAQPAWA